ncbi:MAG: DUF4230 domain-containing protein [Patescibacteria group bacterium]
MTMRTTATVSLLTLLVGAGLASWFFLRPGQTGTRIDTSRDAVIKEMRQLGRLETSSFTIEKIIEAKKDGGGPWRNILFGDKLLLIANGEVVAGYDLSGLTEADVEKVSGSLRVKLPAPQILSVRLDNEKTRVYDRDQGLLSRGDKDLESEARLAAEQSIRDAACAAGILREAEENAVKQLKAVLGALGYPDSIIQSPAGTC